jgi:hypothetical protein
MSRVPVHEIKNNKKRKKGTEWRGENKKGNQRKKEIQKHKTKPLAPVCLLHTPYSNEHFSLVSP